jgi:hypothetical protein
VVVVVQVLQVLAHSQTEALEVVAEFKQVLHQWLLELLIQLRLVVVVV